MVELVGPRKRAQIITAVAAENHWAGAAKGVRITLSRDAAASLFGAEIAYAFTFRRRRYLGKAGNVGDAFQEIGARLDKLKLEPQPTVRTASKTPAT